MGLVDKLYMALIEKDRYLLIVDGLKNTLIMTVFATIIGIVIGVIIAVIKYFAEGNKKLWIFDKICDIYTTVIRGTPVMVQLLILATVILAGFRETSV